MYCIIRTHSILKWQFNSKDGLLELKIQNLRKAIKRQNKILLSGKLSFEDFHYIMNELLKNMSRLHKLMIEYAKHRNIT